MRLITSDDHAGLGQARRACFPSVPWQRCQFHLLQNALHYVPKLPMRREVAAICAACSTRPIATEAERQLAVLVKKYQATAPKLAAWLEANVPEGLTVFALPAEHRRRLRTSNPLERLNEEIKRRTRVATLFPNEASLLRLVTAILQETSEDWETGKIYLNLETN